MNGVKKKVSAGHGTGASAVTLRFAIDLAKPTEESTINEFSYEQLKEKELEGNKVLGLWCASVVVWVE